MLVIIVPFQYSDGTSLLIFLNIYHQTNFVPRFAVKNWMQRLLGALTAASHCDMQFVCTAKTGSTVLQILSLKLEIEPQSVSIAFHHKCLL